MLSRSKNKYYKRSHISESKFRQLVRCFTLDLNAYETSKIINISHVHCKRIYHKLKLYIYNNLLEEDTSKGTFECDESYFGSKRVRG